MVSVGGGSVSALFRTQLVLMLLGAWGFGCHVADPQAFKLRLQRRTWKVPT